MGFDQIDNPKYLRFPLWILYMFSPESSISEIYQRVEAINSAHEKKTKDCAMIASHDRWGTRKMICDGLEYLLPIDYAGKWRNNTNELWYTYGNDKISCLKNFKFNICPENINQRFYVTEKLFEAFAAGAVPIYYGADNVPEPDVVNSEAVLFWNPDEMGASVKKQIEKFRANSRLYEEFIHQPKLLPTASDYVINQFDLLHKKIGVLIG